MAARTAWKASERALAKLVGGRRVPVDGRGGQPDIEHAKMAVEVKRRALPQWLTKGMGQALWAAAGTGKTPVVIVHEPGSRYLDSYVIVRLRDALPYMEDSNENTGICKDYNPDD